MDRETAWKIVCGFVQDSGLRRHMLAVKAATSDYAPQIGGSPDQWALVGLLHDFDWGIHPNLQDHPAKGAKILGQRSLEEDLVRAISSHNTTATGVKREKPIDFALLACDEITGLIVAVALVRPGKDIRDMSVKSVRKKWKDKAFAAGVDRGHVAAGHHRLQPRLLRRSARVVGPRGERAEVHAEHRGGART